MARKKQIHEAQTDLIPPEKKDIPADDVRLFLKNLTLHNMQSLKSKIATATIKEHELIQNAINSAMKGADIVPYYPNGAVITNNNTVDTKSTVKVTGLTEEELDRIIAGG